MQPPGEKGSALLPLCTENLRRGVLGKWASAIFDSRKHRQEEGQDRLYSRLHYY